MAERDFKGVWIPKQVWLDENLTMLDKGILTEIDSLDMGEDGCWASNEYLAKFCQCTERKVSNTISKLIDLGYVKVISFDGRTRKLRSCIEKTSKQDGKNNKAGTKKVLQSNTKTNTTNKPKNSITRSGAESDFPDDFMRFYNEYPRKVSKPSALRAWKSLKAGAALTDRIIADVKQRCETEWKHQDIRYIPYPSTYLNQRRWEDGTSPTDRGVRRADDRRDAAARKPLPGEIIL